MLIFVSFAACFIGMVENAERSGCADQFLLVETVTWPIKILLREQVVLKYGKYRGSG